MKKSNRMFLSICILGLLCALVGCKKQAEFQTAFPLDAETVTMALEETGLPGVIDPSETSSWFEGHTHYTIRSETECYADTDNKKLIADISSADYDGQRALATIFDQEVSSKQIVWEDWEQQIQLAALLYGGFRQEQDVYQAFLGKELPDGKEAAQWDAQLPEGYCTISYHYRTHGNGKQSAFIRVNIYESYELYQQIKQTNP